MHSRLLFSLFIGALCFSAQAAEIRKGPLLGRDLLTIFISGEIVPGDSEKLNLLLKSTPLKLYYKIALDSPGGNVAEAIKMADILKPLYFQIEVPKDKACASACFVIWLAGSPRMGNSIESIKYTEKSHSQVKKMTGAIGDSPAKGIVGVHRPYFGKNSNPSKDQVKLMSSLATYLDSQMIPRRIIDLMMSRASNDIYWLEDRDFEEIGMYSPEVEEFLISKCGYVSLKSHHVNDRERLEKIFDSKIRKCVDDVVTDLHDKSIANTIK